MFLEIHLLKNIFKGKEGFVSENKPNRVLQVVATILQIIVVGVAGYLCWKCNGNTNLALKIFYTFLAVLFSGIYILWYVIYHMLLKVPCPSK